MILTEVLHATRQLCIPRFAWHPPDPGLGAHPRLCCRAGSEAILVAGPGGAGKTTTCVGLMGRPGVRLVTENLLFTMVSTFTRCSS